MKKKQFFVLLLTFLILVSNEKPVMAMSAEERSGLEDNVIEYGAVEVLVSNYNITVKNNSRVLNNMKATSSAMAEELRNYADELSSQADELYDQAAAYKALGNAVTGGDSNSSLADYGESLASLYTGAAQLEIAADELYRQADSLDASTVDRQMYQIQFKQVEAQLVNTIKGLYPSYYQIGDQIGILNQKREYYIKLYDIAISRQLLGMAAELDAADAKNQIQDMDNQIKQLRHQEETLLQTICNLIDRDYNTEIVLQGMPAADRDYLGAIDLTADTKKAIGNSYDLRYARRELSNLSDADDKKAKRLEISSKEQGIENSLYQQRSKISDCQDMLDSAELLLASEESRMNLAKQKYELGMISQLEYQQQKNTYDSYAADVKAKERDLFWAEESYQAIVNGL